MYAKCAETPEENEMLSNTALEWIYRTRTKEYRTKENTADMYKNKSVLEFLIHDAIGHHNIGVKRSVSIVDKSQKSILSFIIHELNWEMYCSALSR